MLKKITISLFFILYLTVAEKVTGQNLFYKNFAVKSLDSVKFEKTVEKIIFKKACLGYPFCRFSADSVIKKGGKKLGVYYILDLQEQVFIKNIYVAGKRKPSKEYIYNLTGINPAENTTKKKSEISAKYFPLNRCLKL